MCIDFRDLNTTNLKDEYLMPITNMLINDALSYEILNFVDGHSSYNQIYIAKKDVLKIAFRCSSAVGTYEWVVLPFGLKNAGATYQRAMNTIFHDLIGKIMEVYVDDIVVKSIVVESYLENLRQAFDRMRK